MYSPGDRALDLMSGPTLSNASTWIFLIYISQALRPVQWLKCNAANDNFDVELNRFPAFPKKILFGFARFELKNSPLRNTKVLVLCPWNAIFMSELPLPCKNLWMFCCYTNRKISTLFLNLIIKYYHGTSEFRWILSRRNISPPPPAHVTVLQASGLRRVDGGYGNEFGFDN